VLLDEFLVFRKGILKREDSRAINVAPLGCIRLVVGIDKRLEVQ